jgi:hypothetical protein
LFVFLFDVIYLVMLYQKFRELGLNPFTRAPVDQAGRRARA